MTTTLAFDVYGTLIDTNGVVTALENLTDFDARQFSATWREKQLEYTFRRALMHNYVGFDLCTRQALDYTCTLYQVNLKEIDKDDLLRVYRALPPFSDAIEGLSRLKDCGLHLFAFSNGQPEALEELLTTAGLRDFFIGIVSVDEVKSFKPSVGVYCHFMRRAGVDGGNAWMISSNGFDVIGAISAGMKAAWVRRSPQMVLDPWGIEPTLTISNLTELADALAEGRS